MAYMPMCKFRGISYFCDFRDYPMYYVVQPLCEQYVKTLDSVLRYVISFNQLFLAY